MSETTVDYKILRASSPLTLEASVKNYIKDDWQPLGGVAVECDGFKTFYHQVVVLLSPIDGKEIQVTIQERETYCSWKRS